MLHPLFAAVLSDFQRIYTSGKGIGPEPTASGIEGREKAVVSDPAGGSSSAEPKKEKKS